MLGLGFHTFGNDGQLHTAPQGNNRPGNGNIMGVIRQPADEGLVDLENVQGQALEVAQ
ncbi:hypothetical protein D3C80_1654360 [compost metagenome]